jgi:lysine 2,3-aminomutase
MRISRKTGSQLVGSEKYPPLVTKHFLSLAIDKNPEKDPILIQVAPSPAEDIMVHGFNEDPQDEKRFSPLPKLVWRYKDRALILCTNNCFIHCRFCFRKRLWARKHESWRITSSEFAKIANHVRKNPVIKEAILSGGDPLTLRDKDIFRMISKLDEIDSLNVIRIGTRALSAMPSRLAPQFIKGLMDCSDKIWFMTHFNHPAELSSDTELAIRRLTKAGIPVLTQTVLLKGVNDDVDVLSILFRRLVALKAKPHYLFHVDPTEGNAHFATGVDKALDIVSELRNRMSSLCVPSFAIDLPSGGGKIVLSPDLRKSAGKYRNYEGGVFDYFSMS